MWAGLSVLSSAIRRNLLINQGIYLLYPNLYVVLVGPPGKVGKSTTIRMGRRLLLGLGDEIIFGPDSTTREELIRLMSVAGRNRRQSAMTLHSTEMSSLIDPSGVRMIQLLTEIYDGDIRFSHSTKHSGRDKVENPVLNILAGTTPSWIAEGLPSNIIGHGFTARVVFVYGEKPRYLKPFPKEPDPELVRKLVNDLDHISRIEGVFEWGEGAEDLYEKMYEDLAHSIPKDYRIEGFHNRKKIHVLKVAMLLSISESDELVIDPINLEMAWKILEGTETDMARSFSAVGRHEGASDVERILLRIQTEGEMTEDEIHREFFAMGDVQTIANHLLMLKIMKKIRREDVGEGKSRTTIYYPV